MITMVTAAATTPAVADVQAAGSTSALSGLSPTNVVDFAAPTTLTVSPWQAIRPWDHPEFVMPDDTIGPFPKYFNDVRTDMIPSADSAGWGACGAGNPLCPDAGIIAMSMPSRVPADACGFAGDATHYQAFISVPLGTTFSQATITVKD